MVDRLLHDPLFAASAAAAALRKRPLGFVDVGARDGVSPVVRPLAGVTAVLGFEPDAAECGRLRAQARRASPWADLEYEPRALADRKGRATLHLLAAPTNHSLRAPNEGFIRRYGMEKWRVKGREPLETVTLDSVLFGERAGETHWGEFIKLDTQGTEHEILEGARRTLEKRTVAVLTEVEFCQAYAGQRLFSDVELLLRGLGFSFYGFTTFHVRSRKLLDKRREAGRERAFYADAVFFKDPLPGGPAGAAVSERGLKVLFCCALLLGYNDFALELATETWAKGAEAKRLRALVRRWAGLPPAGAAGEALELAKRVRSSPERALIEVGRFIETRQLRFSYEDVAP